MTDTLIRLTERGFYCAAGDFYIDPWQPVERAVITHAHADHARWGSNAYLGAAPGERVLRARVGDAVQSLPYGEPLRIRDATVTFFPAGHILGSAQVRVEHNGEVWVISGDYKTEPDATCAPFEPVRCHTFVTESTFGLPIYRWQPQLAIFAAINDWWRANAAESRTSILYGYALGKAQRLLAGVDPSIGPILTHGAVERLTREYRAAGVPLPETTYAFSAARERYKTALVVAPPSAHATPWMRRFGNASTGFASGWMTIRGARRRRAVDRGFALSDHVDWPSLLGAIAATGAERVWVTHGYTAVVVRWLEEHGIEAAVAQGRYEGEEQSEADTVDALGEDGVAPVADES